MTLLAVVPTQRELDLFHAALCEVSARAMPDTIGVLPVTRFPELGLVTALGGLGKAQFAVHTHHLTEHGDWELVVCAGAAGALADDVRVGDVVIATETVEHDINNRFGPPRIPRFAVAEPVLARCRAAMGSDTGFAVLFAPVASGDEDVMDEARRADVRARTGAVAVAWEGAGGARGCALRSVPFVEIRGISDGADSSAHNDYAANLPRVMRHVAAVVIALAGDGE